MYGKVTNFIFTSTHSNKYCIIILYGGNIKIFIMNQFRISERFFLILKSSGNFYMQINTHAKCIKKFKYTYQVRRIYVKNKIISCQESKLNVIKLYDLYSLIYARGFIYTVVIILVYTIRFSFKFSHCVLTPQKVISILPLHNY